MGRAIKDITGQRFGHLTVIKRAKQKTSNCNAYWHVVCDCGTERVVRGDNLRRYLVTSCGCTKEIVPDSEKECHNCKHRYNTVSTDHCASCKQEYNKPPTNWAFGGV